uniref:Uncharacterized protein n=1 Tax=Pristionchus pacificus TaxID=54126 RepID=A0A2A6C461_PRIPA|eukprot:PDM73022.1 hypothetical protein PRIPAC_39456 [Pristionchus pacificus]
MAWIIWVVDCNTTYSEREYWHRLSEDVEKSENETSRKKIEKADFARVHRLYVTSYIIER